MVGKLPLDLGARADTRTYLYRLPNSAFGGGGRMMINGARTAQVAFDEDGVPNRSPSGGGMLHEHSINVESIQSWRYTLVNANAESRAPAQVSLVTKSGTNDFHGVLYWDTHHSVFDANNHNAPKGSKKGFVRNNYEGLNVSGPVYLPRLYDGRSKTFFMFTAELFQNPSRGTGFQTVPTDAMRRGDFSDLRNPSGQLIPITDPLTGQPFADNKIPVNRVYPGAKPYLDRFYPLPNIATATFNNNLFLDPNFDYNTPSVRVDARIDQAVSDRNKLFFRHLRYTNPSSNFYKFFGSGENISRFNFHTYQVADTHTFRPNLLNEFRFAMSDVVNVQRVGAEARSVLNALGVQGVPEVLLAPGITGLPQLGITGISGITQFNHGDSNSRLYDIFDNVTYLRARHSIKAGVNLRRDSDLNNFYDKPGQFDFTGFFTGFGLADFMLGLPFRSVRSYPRVLLGPVERASWYVSGYVQDDFKMTPRLTLNFGLRWDANLPGTETHDLYYNFDPKSGNLVVPTQEAISKIVPTFPTSVKSVIASQAGFPDRLRSTDRNNFAPRLGLAWRPLDERTVVRAAYGIYNDGLSLGYIPTGGPWGGNETFTNAIQNGRPLWQFPAAFPAGVVGQIPGTVGINAFDVNLRNPYVQQWNLTLERQIEETVVRIQYVGTKSTHLYWYRNVNLPEPSTIPFSDSRRPYPQYGGINIRTNGGNSTYHAMTLAAERRLRQGITFNSYFTWSRLLTDSYESGGESNALDIGRWFPTFYRSKWKGNETHNPKFRWASRYQIWQLEVPDTASAEKVRQALLANEAAPLPALSAVAPVQFNAGVPDRIASGIKSNKGLNPNDFFLDPAAFVIPAANIGRFGTSGTNFIQEPTWWTFDFGVQKTFPIRERLRFELVCKIKNLINHGFWGRESTAGGLNLSNPATFGTMAGGYEGSRNIGFLGRLAW